MLVCWIKSYYLNLAKNSFHFSFFSYGLALLVYIFIGYIVLKFCPK